MLRPKNLILAVSLILAVMIEFISQSFLLNDKGAMAGNFLIREKKSSEVLISGNNYLLPLAKPPVFEKKDIRKEMAVVVTAYSSSVGETDNDPLITASGKRVHDGIIANNLLPFGTKVRLPELFGDKVFVVEDRMNKRKGYYQVDIWFPSKEAALKFGSKITEMEILK